MPTSKSMVNFNSIYSSSMKRSTSLNNLDENLGNQNDSTSSSNRATSNRSSSILASGRRLLPQKRDVSKEFLSRFTIGEDGILKCLLQEFPYLHTSPETIHYLWQKHAKQIEILTKAQKELDHRHINNANVLTQNALDPNTKCFNKAELHLRETFRKQELLMDIMRKEVEHLKRMEDLKRKQMVDNSMKATVREQRFQNSKVKRYLDEFRLQQRAKLLKQQTSEELIFKKLFNESLKIQKERMLDLQKYAKEKSELNLKQQLNQIESIENYYKNKFSMLNEHMRSEKDSNLIRERAQQVVLGKLKKQVQTKLEGEVRTIQDQMCRDKDFLYWRQLDADRLKNELLTANYVKPK
jgi:centrosomal protein CEP95